MVEARFGVVLSKEGGIIKKLLPIFNLGGGGIIGCANEVSGSLLASCLGCHHLTN